VPRLKESISAALDALTASLARSAKQTAAIDHVAGGKASVGMGIHGGVGLAPPSRDVAERVAWIVARHRAEHDQLERRPPGAELAAGR
jgi:dihydroxyacetone kinase